MDTGNDSGDDKIKGGGNAEDIALCASCDRCRSRKTKCDGERPCGNCASKYMKKHHLNSVDGIDPALFECLYSPAKRRGPIPGRATGQTRKSSEAGLSQAHLGQAGQQNQMNMQGSANAEWGNNGGQGQDQQQQQQMSGMDQQMAGMYGNGNGGGGGGQGQSLAQLTGVAGGAMDALLHRQAMEQQQQQQGGSGMGGGGQNGQGNASALQQFSLFQQLQQQQVGAVPNMNDESNQSNHNETEAPPSRRVKMEGSANQANSKGPGIPWTITQHTHLLERGDPDGSRLRAYYKLSIDELYRLPPTPTDEEYCTRLNVPGMTPRMIPGSHLAALSAVRFAEVALGAIVHNEVSLALELGNAVVHCLRESVQEAVQTHVMFEVAKAYFLLGVFRACRGDMSRYFKYRRVCMSYLAQLEEDSGTQTLLAAVSYLDSWAYMIYNANEKLIPNVDDTLPRLEPHSQGNYSNPTEMKFGVSMSNKSIATDPRNQNWIQGAPPVYLNNEAPLHARSLDALAFAVRTCCDQANGRFLAISKEAEPDTESDIPQETISTLTTTAVLAHENELCSRNMVLSAYTLMQQHESSGKGRQKNEGQHLVISAMDAFLENSDQDGKGGFTDSQIQSLLSVCNTTIENPFLLHHAGPTYHMVSNASVLLCHLMNGMHAMKSTGQFGLMESTMFEEVLDTFISIRKLLTIHRRKLPVKLRCHGIPRPSMRDEFEEGKPFVDLGETLLCACRGCQGFVLMACSPCVAAERARKATTEIVVADAREAEAIEMGELDQELDDLGAEFDMDDDALVSMISNLISN